MMKFEFEKYSGKEISDDDYKKIEIVYKYHPSIEDVGGKNQLSELYCIGKMRIIDDMLPAALLCREMEEELDKLHTQVNNITRWMRELKEGKSLVLIQKEYKSISDK